ncbi:NAC transcription factor 32 [Amborella trichopoda]|uniref:NAC transcription factor 32 n=1 Tax=Amborella trichopoda TaxID=13333 RepID=UPI0005D353F3|nr:NAC transcription factor 32 [Amborella trichopoda]|eukprot:XP_011627853.1 NAC transcription factor 32 [Amborella trichopoda]
MGELDGLPPGFRFVPTEEELVSHYLKNKVSETRSPNFNPDIIRELDIYNHEPFDLLGMASFPNENQLFFFAERTAPIFSRKVRVTGGGYWKVVGRKRPVVSGREGVVGFKTTLVFHKGRAPNGEKTDWRMKEYVLASDRDGIRGTHALCHIYLKSPTKKRQVICESSFVQDGAVTIGACCNDEICYRQQGGTPLPVIWEVKEEEETLIPQDDELHKLLSEMLDAETGSQTWDALPTTASSSMTNQMAIDEPVQNVINWCPVPFISESVKHGIIQGEWNKMCNRALLDGDYIELNDLVSPLADSSSFR